MKTIAIIDDSALVLNGARSVLEPLGYRVLTFDKAGDYDPATSGIPALFLVDINMPEFFGDDIVDYLRDAFAMTAPIYLFSDVDEGELARRAAACHADGYISKRRGLNNLPTVVRTIVGDAG